jgi:SAM-dependent methyltransferase
MEKVVYARMAEQEDNHWWFRGRREILSSLIHRRLTLPPGARILEVGCGTGGNLAFLSSLGELDAIEYDDDARAIASEKSGIAVKAGGLPNDLTVDDGAYDLIALLDVLEHIEEDTKSLTKLSTKLSKTGRLLITVPAIPWLWSDHDEQHHHHRRYTKSTLRTAVTNSGLQIVHFGYFNTLLFPTAVIQRIGKRLIGSSTPDDMIPSRYINYILFSIFRAEKHVVSWLPFPIGLSIFAIIQLQKLP